MSRAKQFNVRMSADELAALSAAADASGYSTSEWARTVLLHAAGAAPLASERRRATRAHAFLARASKIGVTAGEAKP